MSIKGKQFLKRMKTRLLIIFFAAVIFFAVLVARVIYISVAKGQEYQEEVLDQKSYDSLDIPFERGDMSRKIFCGQKQARKQQRLR